MRPVETLTAALASPNLPFSYMNSTGAGSQYDEDYYIRGRQSGKSLYENYRWLPDLTVPMAAVMADHCGMAKSDSILDFGCARGYLVKALTQLGFEAYGVDVSKWAIENADPEVKGKLFSEWDNERQVDWVVAKDVLEHIPTGMLPSILKSFQAVARKGVFIVVPLGDGLTYHVPEYEADVTHVIRWPVLRWVMELYDCLGSQWDIAFRHRIFGIKDNYSQWERGNGFITCRRV